MAGQFRKLCVNLAEFALKFKSARVTARRAGTNREFVREILRSRAQFINLRVKSAVRTLVLFNGGQPNVLNDGKSNLMATISVDWALG
jgi:hypothetical protein